ncbi:cyclin-dependent kinase inhibitor 1C-like [Pristis pectinata]|uniref:cyclin-dependent kinase inhibitor 1C-like n=1 Tax=Pristis pectinata TaxID=685728 RepID=UPI00223DBB7D|nr:cyclin-dependent kinase inhibitor 1C-like [Pristis pectinata]XP_051885203.1 cyclin-dependent kinase inhibitor 1C-like [Pristis pectinata]
MGGDARGVANEREVGVPLSNPPGLAENDALVKKLRGGATDKHRKRGTIASGSKKTPPLFFKRNPAPGLCFSLHLVIPTTDYLQKEPPLPRLVLHFAALAYVGVKEPAMSSVQQLFSGSLERMATRRTFPHQASTAVCRNLFGPIDHEELRRETTNKLREISEQAQQKWNFNFATDTPLEGGEYQWEEGSDVPVFYRESIQRGKVRLQCPAPESCNSDTESSGSADLDSPEIVHRLSGLESRETNQENRSDNLHSGIKPGRLACARKRSSTGRITDFFAKRKRTIVAKASSENGSLSVVPGEQTPRKRIR